MIVFVIALYLVPAILALVAVIVGAKGLKFYWEEVLRDR